MARSLTSRVKDYLDKEEYDQVEEICKQYYEQNHQDIRSLLEIGDIFMSIRRISRALPYLKQAEEIDPNHPDVLGLLGQGHCALMNYFDAKNYASLSLDRDPNNLNGLYCLGLIHIVEKQYPLAEKTFTQIINNHGNVPRVLLERASVRKQLDRKHEAISDCSQAIKSNPNFLPALSLRAGLYQDIGRVDLAQLDYETLSSSISRVKVNVVKKNGK